MLIRHKIFAFVIIVMISTISVFSHAEDPAARPIKYVRGRICDTDYVGSKIVIQWFYSTAKISVDKMTFVVPEKVLILTNKRRIFKNSRNAGIVDLIIGDHVIVKYYDDKKNGDFEAISIRVLEYDRPISP